jgi:hypothetical protein
MGTYNSGCAKIIIPVLNQAGMLMVSHANTYPGLTVEWDKGEPGIYYPTGARNYARVIAHDGFQGTAAAQYMYNDLGKRTLALLDDTQAYGIGLADAVEAELRQRLSDEKIGNISKGDIAIVDSFNITGFVLDPQVQEAIERTAISKQSLQTAQNDVEVAKLQALRNAELQKGLTPEILMNDAIKKWDGSGIPPTIGNSQQFLIQPNTTKK